MEISDIENKIEEISKTQSYSFENSYTDKNLARLIRGKMRTNTSYYYW
jgi:hypothetical protein